MASNRRAFLQMAGLAPAAAAGLVVPRAAYASLQAVELTRAAFASCIGDEFAFETGAFEQGAAKLVLVDGADDKRFRLLFEAPAGRGLAQESYRVSHARLGRFTMFVSPNDSTGQLVEAVFSRP